MTQVRICTVIVAFSLIVAANAFAGPMTLVQAQASANGSNQLGSSGSDPSAVTAHSDDISNGGFITRSDVSGTSAFAANGASMEMTTGYLPPSPGAQATGLTPWNLSVSYLLQVLVGQTWVDVIDASFGQTGFDASASLDHLLSGQLDVTTNVPYEVRSVLDVTGYGGYNVSGTMESVWMDILTFTGAGTLSPIDIDVALLGSMYAGPILGTRLNPYYDARVNATAAFSFFGTSAGAFAVQSASGTPYTVTTVPEPSSAKLLLAFIAAAVIAARCRRTRSAFAPAQAAVMRIGSSAP